MERRLWAVNGLLGNIIMAKQFTIAIATASSPRIAALALPGHLRMQAARARVELDKLEDALRLEIKGAPDESH